jgi:opacity protein-like surface antigen
MIQKRNLLHQSSRAVACALVACTLATPLAATASDGAENSWQLEVTPYLWATGLDGTVAINNRPQSGLAVQQDFSDLFKILDFAAVGSFEAKNGRWGVLVDAVYLKVSDAASVSTPQGFAMLSADATFTQQMYTLLASYRAIEGTSPVDLFGGVRYTSVRGDISISATAAQLPPAERGFVQTKDWVDPVIGVRLQHPLNERWTLVGYADIGGFGVGSDLSWQVQAGANYAFTRDIIGKLGYRAVAFDYDEQNFLYDMRFAGPYAGLGFRW